MKQVCMEANSVDWQRSVSLRSPVCELHAPPASCQEPLPFAACVPEEEDITIKSRVWVRLPLKLNICLMQGVLHLF